jgi:hypothetical protein
VPGYTPGATGLAVVSLSDVDPRADLSAVGLVWGPADIITAWQPGN